MNLLKWKIRINEFYDTLKYLSGPPLKSLWPGNYQHAATLYVTLYKAKNKALSEIKSK